MAVRAASSSFSSSSSTLFSISPKLNPTTKPTLFNLHTHKPRIIKTLKCIHSPPSKHSPTRRNGSQFSCSVVTFLPLQTTNLVPSKLQRLVAEFQSFSEPIDRVKRLLQYASLLPKFDDSSRVDSNRVMGCTAQVWLAASLDKEVRMRFAADSDSKITGGFCYCLVSILDGAAPEEVLTMKRFGGFERGVAWWAAVEYLA
ncbi:hypothetical protein CsatA_002575 [Cannabis sativa]